MKFTWKGFIIAPLVFPFFFSLALITPESKSPVLGFVVFVALAAIPSYAVTAFLFLPSLYLLSKFTTLRSYLVGLLGTVLGALVFFPFAWVSYRSSGPDSGPPVGTFLEFLSRSWGDAITWSFPIAGLVTAMVYWFLASRGQARIKQ